MCKSYPFTHLSLVDNWLKIVRRGQNYLSIYLILGNDQALSTSDILGGCVLILKPVVWFEME